MKNKKTISEQRSQSVANKNTKTGTQTYQSKSKQNPNIVELNYLNQKGVQPSLLAKFKKANVRRLADNIFSEEAYNSSVNKYVNETFMDPPKSNSRLLERHFKFELNKMGQLGVTATGSTKRHYYQINRATEKDMIDKLGIATDNWETGKPFETEPEYYSKIKPTIVKENPEKLVENFSEQMYSKYSDRMPRIDYDAMENLIQAQDKQTEDFKSFRIKRELSTKQTKSTFPRSSYYLTTLQHLDHNLDQLSDVINNDMDKSDSESYSYFSNSMGNSEEDDMIQNLNHKWQKSIITHFKKVMEKNYSNPEMRDKQIKRHIKKKLGSLHNIPAEEQKRVERQVTCQLARNQQDQMLLLPKEIKKKVEQIREKTSGVQLHKIHDEEVKNNIDFKGFMKNLIISNGFISHKKSTVDVNFSNFDLIDTKSLGLNKAKVLKYNQEIEDYLENM